MASVGIYASSLAPYPGLPVRYLRIQRVTSVDYMNVFALEGWLGTQRHVAQTGVNYPFYRGDPALYPWTNLNDGIDGSFSHTDSSADAYFELDYGTTVPMDRVRVIQRTGIPNRILGTQLQVLDSNRNILYRFDFTNASLQVYQFALV